VLTVDTNLNDDVICHFRGKPWAEEGIRKFFVNSGQAHSPAEKMPMSLACTSKCIDPTCENNPP
jgi:hypothetical protein